MGPKLGAMMTVGEPEVLKYGATEAPTLDLSRRPYVENQDGSTSTVRSMGINDGGREVLIPTVSNAGWVMGDDEAVDEYHRTGQHMGVYNSPAASDSAGERIHLDQVRAPPTNTLSTRHVQLDPMTITADKPGLLERSAAALRSLLGGY